MKQTVRDRVLEKSSVYSTFKRLIRAERHTEVFLGEYAKPVDGERILDVGCGTGDIVSHLPAVTYVGVDFNPDYIETAKARGHANAEFVNAPVEALPGLGLGPFDCVIGVGVLHHLSDEVVISLLEDLTAVVVSGARLVMIDPVWSPESRTVARVLAALDRGRHVRDERGYQSLVSSVFPDTSTHIRHDLLALPYTHCITVAHVGEALSMVAEGVADPDAPT